MGSEVIQELPDVILEEHDQGDHTDADQLVENGTKQPHLQHLRHEQPRDDKHQDAIKHIQRT